MAKSSIEITAEDIRRLVDELDPKEVRKLLRSTLGREARRILKAAIQELRTATTCKGQHVREADRVAKTMRGKAYRTGQGLIVTASATKHPERGMYLNSRLQKKPVAFWLDQGTTDRTTRRKGAARGSLKALQFVEKARQRTEAESTRRIVKGYEQGVERIVKRAMK